MGGDNEPRVDGQGSGAALYDIDWTDPSKIDDDTLLHFISGQFLAGKARRSDWEKNAAKQLAWVEGEQDLEWNPSSNQLDRVTRPIAEGIPLQYLHPVRINTLKNTVLQRIAMLLGQDVQLYSIAASEDDEDVSSAVVGTKLFQYLWHAGPRPARSVLVKALWNMFCTGIAWLHPVWDPFAGLTDLFEPDVSGAHTPEQRKKIIEQFQAKVARKMDRPVETVSFKAAGGIELEAGEVRWEDRTGFDLTEPEFAADITECDSIIDTRWRSLEYLKFRYGKEALAGIQPKNNSAEYLNDWRRRYSVGRSSEHSIQTRAELVQVHSFWRPVRPWSPVGAHVVVVGKEKVLLKAPNPYLHGELPFFPLQEMPSEYFRPSSTVRNLMSLQESRNRRRSMVNAHIHETIAPKILKEEGVHIASNAFDGQDRMITVPTGTISNQRIKAWDPPKLPPEVFRLDEMDRRDMADVGGVHDSTTGRGESKSQSGRHAALLQQNDARGNKVTQRLVSDGLAKAGAHSLILWFQFVTRSRTVTITGGDLEGEVLTFTGADLFARKDRKPGPFDWNVRVVMGPDRTLQETLALIETMVGSKVWRPDEVEADRAKIERLISNQMPSDKDEDARQRRNARRENRRLLGGKEVRARIGDDDQRHIEEHEKWSTTDEYAEATKKSDRLNVVVRTHIYEHMMEAADKRLRGAAIEAKVKADLQAEMGLGMEGEGEAANMNPVETGAGPIGQPSELRLTEAIGA